jgi:phage baseplate assembly protein W
MSKGMNAITGQPLEGLDHLRQSITDILTTRLGTRLMRPDYGSNVPNLVDAPQNGLTVSRINKATVTALVKWEPRINVNRVKVIDHLPGQIVIDLEATYLVDGKPITLEGIIL